MPSDCGHGCRWVLQHSGAGRRSPPPPPSSIPGCSITEGHRGLLEPIPLCHPLLSKLCPNLKGLLSLEMMLARHCELALAQTPQNNAAIRSRTTCDPLRRSPQVDLTLGGCSDLAMHLRCQGLSEFISDFVEDFQTESLFSCLFGQRKGQYDYFIYFFVHLFVF